MRRKLTMALALLGMGLFAVIAAGGCAEEPLGEQRESAVSFRGEQFRDAEASVPIRANVNFPRRAALEEYNFRTDRVGTPWYIYILADTGNIIGYYVATTDPVNACTFLSSSEDVRDDNDGNLVLTAPSLDGIFYGGAGASAGCDEWFFFDAATNAMIKIRGVKFFVADQPLALQADAIEVQPVAAVP